MTTRKDFEPFFKLMIEEMQRHDKEKGDSWKNDQAGTITMNEYLDKLLFLTVAEYHDTHRPDQLEDIANICAMRRLRGLMQNDNH